MSCAAMPPSLLLTQVLAQLQRARDRVASGHPSVVTALAYGPGATVAARLEAARAARAPGAVAPPWARVLAESLSRVEHARQLWAGAPDAMPPAVSGLSPCAMELRLYLADARTCAAKGVAWEDPEKLSRAQALCMLHLAVTLAKWEAHQQRSELAVAMTQPTLPPRREPPRRTPPPEDDGPRSLRQLAQHTDAFSAWDEEESP